MFKFTGGSLPRWQSCPAEYSYEYRRNEYSYILTILRLSQFVLIHRFIIKCSDVTQTSNPLVLQIKLKLKKQLYTSWHVSAHKGIQSNECADQLAMKAAFNTTVEPSPPNIPLLPKEGPEIQKSSEIHNCWTQQTMAYIHMT